MAETNYGGVGLFSCPQCKREHPFTQDDVNELQCPDNKLSELKIDRALDNPNALVRGGWNWNRFSTKVTEYRNASVKARLLTRKDVEGKIRNW